MGCGNCLSSAHMVFGNTNRAGGVPDLLAPSIGPVYLEGRLVLSLSFQGTSVDMELPEESDDPLERYRLWDDLAERWHDCDLEVLRYEHIDAVVRRDPDLSILWKGSMDTRARVVQVPDLDEDGMEANRGCDLCWKRV